MAQYALGTGDPVIHPDPGAGLWSSEAWTVQMVAFKVTIVNYAVHEYLIIGPEATRHMLHYLGNSGQDYTINLSGMIGDVPSAKLLYDTELAAAKQFVETLQVGTHNIASGRASNGYNLKQESWNWFYATGGYSAWGKGIATVRAQGASSRAYQLDFEYKFYDRYNWDKGKSVKIFGVTVSDELMGRLHRQGLAQEFDCKGSIRETVNWGAASSAPAIGTSAGGRT